MSLLQMSYTGAILITAIVIARIPLKNKLPKRTFTALWGIALLRLLIPFSVPSVLSAYSVLEHSAPATQLTQGMPVAGFFATASGHGMTTLADAAADSISSGPAVGGVSSGAAVSLWTILRAAGMLVCFSWFAVSYIRCRLEFRTSLPVEHAFIKSRPAVHPLRRRITVRQSDRIHAPLTYGVLRPVILMPKNTDWTNTASLSYVLTHEYVHIRRFDAVSKLVLTAALCIHWFNPLVWVMYVLANRDIELACDEAVVRLLGEQTRAAYARTLISMEEAKSGLTPLCSSFCKNAMEERITAIMKCKKRSWIAVFAAVLLIAGITVIFTTSAAPDSHSLNSPRVAAGTDFTDAEWKRLDALRFDGYEAMSVSTFQTRVWELTDTAEYRNLLERFLQDEALYALKDSNETASFLFYVLEPLTAERWQSREFGGYVSTDYEALDNAVLEYRLTMEILDENALTVRQYNDARIAAVNAIQAFFRALSAEELKNDTPDMLRPELNRLAEQESSDSLKLSVQFTFIPLSADTPAEPASDASALTAADVSGQSENGVSGQMSEAAAGGGYEEPRQYGHGTADDYASLLSLMTPDYRQMSVADFNAALLNWANANYERSQRIMEDNGRNDYQVALSAEERSFVALTYTLSNTENSRRVQSINTGKPEEDPWYGGVTLSKETGAGNGAWCYLWYQFPYHIADKTAVTVEERDRCVSGMLNAVRSFWEESSLDDLLALTQDEVVAKMSALADEYSTGLITISIDQNQVQFESMDERSFNLD